jgi:hypothetical protein
MIKNKSKSSVYDFSLRMRFMLMSTDKGVKNGDG